MTIPRDIYGALTSFLSPLIIGGVVCTKKGKIGLSERLGGWTTVLGTPDWFHGASRGELLGLLPIAKKLSQTSSFFSTMSPSGLDLGKELGAIPKILPFDIPWCVERVLKKISPRSFIFGETELWPWLLGALHRRKIPIFLVNGRISDYTLSRYKALGPLTRDALSCVTALAASSETARERFIALGMDPQKVFVTGNCKYDKDVPEVSAEEKNTLRQELFPGASADCKIITLGSLRPGEEKFWFPVLQKAFAKQDSMKVLLAPRHKEQFDYFAKALSGSDFVQWSELSQKREVQRDLVLVDAFGVLEKLYSISDLAFVGATLVDIGGHNPLEPAAYGVPVVVGPYTANISDIALELEENGALFRVASELEIESVLAKLRDLENMKKSGIAAQHVAARHRGATERVLDVLRSHGLS